MPRRYTVLIDTPDKRREAYSFHADDWDEAYATARVMWEVHHNRPVPSGTQFLNQENV